MDGATGPPAPYEQPPRKRSGCLVALYVLFGIGLFIVVAGGIGIWVFLQTEQGQKVMQVAKSGAEWITVASTAPGTEELRGAGCETAMVGNAGSALDVFMILIPEEEKQAELREQLSMQAGEGNLDDLLLVICTLPRFTVSAPACEDLARTYSSAVEDEPDSFYVMVMQQGQDAPTCQGIYDPDGMLLRQPQLQ
jgi:hypothetical protein